MDRGHRPSRHRRQEVAASEPPAASERRLSLRELTAAADVSVRTVRYYISEGLLPPPVGAGSASSYTAGHLARLRLIARLKGSYLPLKEIRHRLAGLDDIAVRRLLGDEEAPAPHPPPDSAAAYLDRALGSRQAPTAPQSAPPGTRPEGVWGMQASAPLLAAETSPPPTLFSAGADEPAPPPVPDYHPEPDPRAGLPGSLRRRGRRGAGRGGVLRAGRLAARLPWRRRRAADPRVGLHAAARQGRLAGRLGAEGVRLIARLPRTLSN